MDYRCLILLLAGSAIACGGGGGGPGPTPTQLARVAGDSQVGPAGQALPTALQVIVRDAANAPLRNIAITWSAASGGGSVNPTSSTTDVNGIASTTRTLGANAGTQTTTAARSGLTTVAFTSIAQVQGATQIAAVSGAAQSDTVLATLANPLVVRVRDQNNAAVQGVTVTWTAAATGKVNGAATTTTTTDATGQTSVTYQLGSGTGPQSPTAAVTGLAGSPVSFAQTATAGNLFEIVKTSGDAGVATVSTTVNYTVTARDSHGNPKASVTIDWAASGGGGSIAPSQNTTGLNGTAAATRTLSSTAGPHTATAIAAAIPDTVTFTTNATTAPVTAGVTVSNDFFDPTGVTVAQGGTVTWTWSAGSVTHNVTFAATTPGRPADITNRASGSIPRTFTATGTFNYLCTIHGAAMSGSVTVVP